MARRESDLPAAVLLMLVMLGSAFCGGCSSSGADPNDLGAGDLGAGDTVSDRGPPGAERGPAPDVVTGPGCGNGRREPGEQCDDGNTASLDGCDAACRFELTLRVNHVRLLYDTDATCPANAFGGAVLDDLVRDNVDIGFDDLVADGDMGWLLHLLDLEDPAATSVPTALELGILNGIPVAGDGYDGTADLDWWYEIDPLSIDGQGAPVHRLPAAITDGWLSAGPGTVLLPFNLGAGTAGMRASAVQLGVALGAASPPLVSSTGGPPGHLPGEQLDPGLASHASAGSQAQPGRLCAAISALSLKNLPLPKGMVGKLACDEEFVATNSMLDLLVAGCNNFVLGQALKPTQPDTADAAVPAPGAGPPYSLSTDAQHFVVGCTDGAGGAVNLNDCLRHAAYSASFAFAAGRVIPRRGVQP